jgi:hypothetical protein
VEYLQAALPDEEFRANPLLLSNHSVQALLLQMQDKKRGAGGSGTGVGGIGVGGTGGAGGTHTHGTAPSSSSRLNTIQTIQSIQTSKSAGSRIRNPTDALRGKTELLRNAGRAGDAHVDVLREKEFALLWKDSPYTALGTNTNLDLR